MTDLQEEYTIVAQATPPGIGAISVIRLSGIESFKAIDQIFFGKTKIQLAPSHTIHYGKIHGQNEIIDDVLVAVFRAPHSYTGEDSIEISTHGSSFIVQRIITLLLLNENIRIAEPGEFTKRAFLNNRIDLTQAEAVADLIKSRTLTSFRGARNQFDGILSSRIDGFRSRLINISSYVELELDFAEEEIKLIKRSELVEKIQNIISDINNLLNTYSFGRITRDGVNLVICGEPNVGKSSILNFLLKEYRAIVSSIPGTTRDTIREEISIDGLLFKIYDTAGFRVSNEEIELEGIERSRSAIKIADLILFVGDVEGGFSPKIEKELLELNSNSRIIKVLNKIDLGNHNKYFGNFEISVKTGAGMMDFIPQLKKLALDENVYSEHDAIINNIRHFSCLERAKINLERAIDTVDKNLGGEFIAVDLRAAEIALCEIIGIVTPDDILNHIFSEFCIGK